MAEMGGMLGKLWWGTGCRAFVPCRWQWGRVPQALPSIKPSQSGISLGISIVHQSMISRKGPCHPALSAGVTGAAVQCQSVES